MPSATSMPQSSGKMAFREEAGGNRQAEGPLVDPRTGVVVPPEIVFDQPVAEVVCRYCGCSMVPRRRKDGTAFFFGCFNFGKSNSALSSRFGRPRFHPRWPAGLTWPMAGTARI